MQRVPPSSPASEVCDLYFILFPFSRVGLWVPGAFFRLAFYLPVYFYPFPEGDGKCVAGMSVSLTVSPILRSCVPPCWLFSSVQLLSRLQLFATPWLQHARPPCPSLTPGVYSNSCPSSQWCHPTTSSSVVPFSSLPPIPPSIRVFSNESNVCMRWPKYWSFSFSIDY